MCGVRLHRRAEGVRFRAEFHCTGAVISQQLMLLAILGRKKNKSAAASRSPSCADHGDCLPSDQAIAVVGVLAGMSAVSRVLGNGGKGVLLDKSSFCGGNSTNATGGISGRLLRLTLVVWAGRFFFFLHSCAWTTDYVSLVRGAGA